MFQNDHPIRINFQFSEQIYKPKKPQIFSLILVLITLKFLELASNYLLLGEQMEGSECKILFEADYLWSAPKSY